VVDRPLGAPLLVPGHHNQVNAAFAVALGEAIALGRGDQMAERLADFPGLPHRLRFVGAHAGVRCYNDSKSTTPDAAMLAIDAFEPNTVHAILGGYDKGVDLAELARHAAGRCRGIYTIGATGDAIAAAVDDPRRVHRSGTLDRAVQAACARASEGEVVLLSPGCASWDQFDHYEQRGDRFTQRVRAWFGGTSPRSP
jgi:UDP-N-acetylmuramoylalanine--D-glutamate ligase